MGREGIVRSRVFEGEIGERIRMSSWMEIVGQDGGLDRGGQNI
jgi:hypothetical protein